MPLYNLVVSTVLASPKVFADDTTLPVLERGDAAWPKPLHAVSTAPFARTRAAATCRAVDAVEELLVSDTIGANVRQPQFDGSSCRL